MLTDRTVHNPTTYRLVSALLIVVIAVGAILNTVAPAKAGAPMGQGSTNLAQIDAQIQRASHALKFTGSTVELERSQLAGMDANLRAAIELFVRDLQAGKLGFAVVVNDRLRVYGNRSEILRQVEQHQRQLAQQASKAPTGGAQPSWVVNVRLANGWLYTWFDSDWTRLLKSRNFWIVNAVIWFIANVTCTWKIVCWAIETIRGYVQIIINQYLVPINPGSFTLAFHLHTYVLLMPWRWGWDGYQWRWIAMGWRQTPIPIP